MLLSMSSFVSRTYRSASSVPFATASRALLYISRPVCRPFSAHSAPVSLGRRWFSHAAFAVFLVCSDSWPRSSDADFGANSMPSPAPIAVPASRPITKLPPPPLSLSNRSYPPAMAPPLNGFRVQILSVLRWNMRCRVAVAVALEERVEGHTRAADDADDAAAAEPDVRTHAIGCLVDAIDRRADRVVDAIGFLFHFRADAFHIVEDGVHPGHRRFDEPLLDAVDETHHPAERHERPHAEADDQQRLEGAGRRDDSEQNV